MSSVSSPRSQTSSLSSDPIQVNHPEEDSASNIDVNPQSPTAASDLTNLSDISSLDAEEYDLLDDSSSESNDGRVHNQQNETFRSRSFSSIQTQTQRDNRDDQGQTDADGSQSQSMDGNSSIDEDQAQSTVGSNSIRNHHHHFGRNEEGSSFNSTPNQSYHPQQHSTAQHSPQSRSTSDSDQHSTSQLNSKVQVKSEGRNSRSSLSPTLSPYSVNQSHFSDHSMSSSNLSFPDPLGQSFLGPNSARLTQAGGVENDARSADKRREVGVQARWESQEEQNGSEKGQLVSEKVILGAENPKKLPLSDSFTFLSDASTSPSIQTQNLSLSPTTSPKIVSDGYGCISRGGNRWREEKSTHNRHPWHVERSDKSVSSHEGGASLLDGVNSNPSQQRSRGLGLDTLGEDQDGERRTDDDDEEEGSQPNVDQHQELRDDSWSDIRHDEAASIRGDDYDDDDESEQRGFCPSTNDESEFRSESGDSHVTGSGKGGNVPPALILSGRLSKSTSTEPQALRAMKPQIKRSTSSALVEESLTIVHFGLSQGQSTNYDVKSNSTISSTAITHSILLSLAGSLDGKIGDGTVDEISRSKEEGSAEVRVFETQKKGSSSKTVVRTLDFTSQDSVDVSQLRTIVEAEQGEPLISILVVATLSNGEKASSNLSDGLKELQKVMKPQEGNQIKAQVHLLPILCPALPSNLYDGDLHGDQESESSESNDIVQGLTRQADLQTAEKEWERVLEEASLLGVYGVNHVKPFGKVMLRLEDLLDSKTPNSEWISKLVQPSKSSSFSASTSKVVVPQISLATSMGMVNRKSYHSLSTIKPSTASTRPPTWLSKTLTWLPTSANPISSSFSSSSSNSSGDPIKQREKERETSPTQEGVKHEAQMAAQEYLEQIDKDVAEAEKMAEQVEELDDKRGEGRTVRALNSTPTKVKSSSNVTPKKSANATLSSSPGSSRFRGSPQAKALLERSNQLRQKRQKLAQEHQRQQNRDSWVNMDFGRISGWIQSKIPVSGEDGEQRFGLATLLTFLLFVVTSVTILFTREIVSSSVFKSSRSSISTQDSSALNRLVFGTGQPVSGFQTKKKGNSITSLNRVESSALSLASSSKAKALALFESGSPSNSNVTISFTHCGKGTFEQSKELSTHLYDDFSTLLKDGSQSASDWISGKVSQPKMVWNSSSKDLISTNHVSKALSNLRDFTFKFLYHASKVANALLDSVRKEWEVYLQEMLRIWKIVMELAQDFQTFSKPYRQWIFVKSKELSTKIAENGRNLSNEIEKLEIKNQILKHVESQRAKLHHRRKQFQAQTLKTRKEVLKYCEREVEDDRKEEVRLKEELYKKEIGKRISLFKSQDEDGVRRSPRLKSKSLHPSMSSSSNTGQPLNAKVLMNSDRDLFVECIKRKARKVYEDRSPFERAENAFQSVISRSVVIKGNFDRLLIKASSGGSKLRELAKVKVEKLTTKLSFGRAKEARRVRRQNQKDLFKRINKDRQAKKRNGRVAKALRAGGKKGKEFWK